MIKKFKEYVKESNEYKNIVIGDDNEFYDMIDEQGIEIAHDEENEIEIYLHDKKYVWLNELPNMSNDMIAGFKQGGYPNIFKITTRNEIYTKEDDSEILYLAVKISNFENLYKAEIDIYKLKDSWFGIQFLRGASAYRGRLGYQYYKCDEMQGLLNQIDELVKKYLRL